MVCGVWRAWQQLAAHAHDSECGGSDSARCSALQGALALSTHRSRPDSHSCHIVLT
ncbi:hypothetical protein JYU34_007879 [Plutella xylostella]|uniref:Uncharacterized protein n=1 Tax=Plutella xylostella TaxID=51655 RepID=A0ABQ7QRI0_PLUXY|nr:hypothetical protein JYU34_007879 [Plutella xylostella]